MSGFTSVAASEFECLNLLFTSWTLTTPLRFGLACVGTFLLAILTELLTKWRRELSKVGGWGGYCHDFRRVPITTRWT